MFRAFLLASSMLYAVPAFAVIDPDPASKNDARLRSVIYDPDNPVELYTVPGASVRIEVGRDETIDQVITSDQNILQPAHALPPPPSSVASSVASADPRLSSCDRPPSCNGDMCLSVCQNFIYLKATRQLDRQPLFIQTFRTNEAGVQEQVGYAFELFTQPIAFKAPPTATDPSSKALVSLVNAKSDDKSPDDKKQDPVWGLRFVYPERIKAAQRAAWLAQKRVSDEAKTAAIAHVVTAVPGPGANWRYGYRGAASTQPDMVWDDGRTTYIRFNGNRRLPNIYNRLPDGHESIPASAPEPDATGNTIRIAGTGTKWFLRDGDETGCLFDVGPDPEGRTAPTMQQVTVAPVGASLAASR